MSHEHIYVCSRFPLLSLVASKRLFSVSCTSRSILSSPSVYYRFFPLSDATLSLASLMLGLAVRNRSAKLVMDSSASIPVVASLWCQSTKWPACLDVVTVNPVGMFDFEGQKVQVPARSVRKRFKPGDYVKVMSGKNADESDPVVSVSCPYANGDGTMTYPTQSMSPAPDPNSSATPDPTSSLDGYAIQSSPLSSSPERFLEPTALGNIVTFLSDMSMQEVSWSCLTKLRT